MPQLSENFDFVGEKLVIFEILPYKINFTEKNIQKNEFFVLDFFKFSGPLWAKINFSRDNIKIREIDLQSYNSRNFCYKINA